MKFTCWFVIESLCLNDLYLISLEGIKPATNAHSLKDYQSAGMQQGNNHNSRFFGIDLNDTIHHQTSPMVAIVLRHKVHKICNPRYAVQEIRELCRWHNLIVHRSSFKDGWDLNCFMKTRWNTCESKCEMKFLPLPQEHRIHALIQLLAQASYCTFVRAVQCSTCFKDFNQTLCVFMKSLNHKASTKQHPPFSSEYPPSR